MNALTYIEHGKFALLDKPKPEILDPRDAVVRVTLGSICTLLCVMLKNPKQIIVCEKDPARIAFVREHYPDVLGLRTGKLQGIHPRQLRPWRRRCGAGSGRR